MTTNEVSNAAALIGRMGGMVRNGAKAAAARENGCKPKRIVELGQVWTNALMKRTLTVEGFETLNGERLVILRADDDTLRKMTRKDLRARFALRD